MLISARSEGGIQTLMEMGLHPAGMELFLLRPTRSNGSSLTCH